MAKSLRSLTEEVVLPFYVGLLRVHLNLAEDYTRPAEEREEARRFLMGEDGKALAQVAAWSCGARFLRWSAWIDELKDRWEAHDQAREVGSDRVLRALAVAVADGRVTLTELERRVRRPRQFVARLLKGKARATQGVADELARIETELSNLARAV